MILFLTPVHEVIVSAVVAWEIAIKRSLGKLKSPDDLTIRLKQCGFQLLPITFEHASSVESLPMHHRDPFDRLLISQAILEEAVLVTRDEWFDNYQVDLIKA